MATTEFTLPAQPVEKPQSIKSYIYTPVKIKQEPANIENPVKNQPTPELSPQPKIEKAAAVTNLAANSVESPADTNKKAQIDDKQVQAALVEKPKQLSKKTFSAHKQLSKLRSQLNQQIMTQEYSAQSETRSHSAMHLAPKPVPHSVPILSQEQKDKANTTSYSSDTNITKYENGTCMVEQDLSSVGIAGVKSQQYFACGESKFDKSFREHMKKVQAKLGK